MNTKPEITDSEIQSYMDFDKLLKAQADARALRKRRFLKSFGLGALSGAALLSAWLFYKSSETEVSAQSAHQEVQNNASTPTKKDPDTLSVSRNSPDEKRLTAENPDNRKTKTPAPVAGKSEPKYKTDSSTVKKEIHPNPISVFSQAEPVDGYQALYAYFNHALTYPPEAVADSVEGVVTVVFSISIEGKAEKIYIEQSLGELFDREAVRVIQHMPLWKPATYNGKAVSSKISLPLTFQIKKVKTP